MNAFHEEKAGIMVGFYDDAGCTGAPMSFANIRMDACILDLDEGEDGTPKISFVKIDSCNVDGDVKIRAFSDSGCENPLYVASTSASKVLNHFNNCGYNDDVREFEKFQCMQ